MFAVAPPTGSVDRNAPYVYNIQFAERVAPPTGSVDRNSKV